MNNLPVSGAAVRAELQALDDMHQAMVAAVDAGHWTEVERIDQARVKLIHQLLSASPFDPLSIGETLRQANAINETILKQAAAARIAAAGKLRTMARRQAAVDSYQRAS